MGWNYGPARGEPDGNISIACPLAPLKHGDKTDSNFSCSVSYGRGTSLAKCFSSNCLFQGSFLWLLKTAAPAWRGSRVLDAFMSKHLSSERSDGTAVAAALADLYKPPSPEEDRPAAKETRDPFEIPESALSGFSRDLHPYAVGRGITQVMWDRWGLSFDARLQRIVFPVRRLNGKLIGLTGRDVTGVSDRKYHNYVGLKRSEVLYGEHLIQANTPIVVVEGQIDAILVDGASGLCAVAPLGEGFSKQHVDCVFNADPPYVILFPDNDAAGRVQAEKIAHSLDGRFRILLAVPPISKDPGDLTSDEIKTCIDQARPLLDDRILWDQ